MDTTTRRTIALALATPEDAVLWQGIFESQGLRTLPFGDRARLPACSAMLADAPALIGRGLRPADAARWLATAHPGTPLFVRLPGRAGTTRGERDWAQARGIASLLPGGTVAAWRESILPMVERILAESNLPSIDEPSLERHIRELVQRGVEPRPGPAKNIYADALVLQSQHVDAISLCHAMQAAGGVQVADRTWRGRRYRECFVASEAIDWLEQRMKLRRATAEAAGRFLWRTGRIHHVAREAPFTDDFLFFRFAGAREALARVDLARLEDAMHAPGGLDIADRTWRGRAYPRCFVGAEAVEWIMRQEHVSFGTAEALGQSLLELGALGHVAGEHDFIGDGFFYRLARDEAALVEVRVA